MTKNILKGAGLGLIFCNLITLMAIGTESLKWHGILQVTLIVLGGICYIAGVILS